MKRLLAALSAVGLLAVALYLGASFSRSLDAPEMATVLEGPLTVWSPYQGTLQARRMETIISSFNGSATVTELVPEGTAVKRGDLLVRFDSSQVERDLLKLERDYALAKSELEGLEQARIPLETHELELKMLEARAEYEGEVQFLEDSKSLLEEKLISEQELEQQRVKTERLQARLQNLEMQLDLTRRYLQPSKRARAQATLAAAEQELQLARQQLEHCTVVSPSDGVVVYKPLHIGGTFRTVRVGDALFMNQPFMVIPDLSEMVVECFVPEAELARAGAGMTATVTPVAFPALQLPAEVESVGSMAQAAPGHPAWQRYFRLRVALRDPAPELRPGMSATVRIQSYHKARAALVPRTAVWWEGDQPYCRVRRGRHTEPVPLTLGQAAESQFEVLAGLEPGETVVLP